METSQPLIRTAGEQEAHPWRSLYRVAGIAALAAGLVFRRNIGAEVSLFSPAAPPVTVSDWFALLHSNPLLGMAYLNFFDVIDYALLGLVFLALYIALKHARSAMTAVALACGLVGVGVYFASNSTFTMLALSDQYAAATGEAQRGLLLAAGQALLALNPLGPGYPGMGIYLSFLLLALAQLLFALAMPGSGVFNRAAAWVGILAGAVDLAYCVTFAALPGLTVFQMSTAGLLWAVWHILVGVRLIKM